MNEIDVLANYVDYKIADGCLDWQGYKTYRQRQEISKDFDSYVESKSKKSLKDLLLRFDNQLETLNLNFNELKKDVNEIKSEVNEIKKEIKEINDNLY